MDSSLAAPFREGRDRAAPPYPLALYIVGEGGLHTLAPGASLSLSLAKPCRDHLCFHHHAIVLLDLHQPLFPPCWIKLEETSSQPYVC